MLVMWTGSPPPSCDWLDGVVKGVNASLDCWVRHRGRVRPRAGRPGDAVRLLQHGRPSDDAPDQQALAPAGPRRSPCVRFSSRKYSLPSGLTSTLKHSFGDLSTGDRISFCCTAGR